ncbi:MAG: 16S rRNA (cytosine(1402)-N(4))-methyltransferase RsmH [Rhodothermia bacterium]
MTGSGHIGEGAYHVPVLCKAVLEGLVTDRSGTYVDGTVGGGGHTISILDALEAAGRVFGIDQDPDAIAVCRARFSNERRFSLLEGNFGEMGRLLSEAGVEHVDGILLDLGVSSHQIDTPGRGFSYRADGPLDMRMDQTSDFTAGDFVNQATESELAQTLRAFGEEPRSRKISAAIVKARPVESTRDFADVVAGAVPPRDQVKTLSRVFQAIRIRINNELDVLERTLFAAVDLLRPGGRIAVISYHSLEDRRTKLFFRSGNLKGIQVRDLYGNLLSPLRLVTRKPIVADDEESRVNPRSRSARLRIAERVADIQ